VTLGGVDLCDLAAEVGTPAFVVDEAHLLGRLAAFQDAFEARFGDRCTCVYAGKAFLCGALVVDLIKAGWWVDVVSTGELEIATRAGMPAARTLMHGNAKPCAELADAVARGVGRIVVDHPGEIDVLSALAVEAGRDVAILLRLNADVAAVTHEKVKTTGDKAQFGMDAQTASEAVSAAFRAPGVRLKGVHVHVGSQIRDLETFRRAAEASVASVEPHRDRFDDRVDLDLGGGLAVAYLRDDAECGIADYAGAIHSGLASARAVERLGDVRLLIEPGRSVVARAGVTLYRVEARKRLPDGRELVALDGGLSDNPRPALYGQHYEVVSVDRATRPHDKPFHVVGRHCETGDVVNDDARLPADTAVGDLVAVPVTGAYSYSMSSRYNGLRRPPVIFVRDGVAREVIRRETFEDLVACDRVISP